MNGESKLLKKLLMGAFRETTGQQNLHAWDIVWTNLGHLWSFHQLMERSHHRRSDTLPPIQRRDHKGRLNCQSPTHDSNLSARYKPTIISPIQHPVYSGVCEASIHPVTMRFRRNRSLRHTGSDCIWVRSPPVKKTLIHTLNRSKAIHDYLTLSLNAGKFHSSAGLDCPAGLENRNAHRYRIALQACDH